MIAYLTLIVALLGLLLWFWGPHAKVQEIGKILFFCGMFVFTMSLGSKTVKLF